MLKKIVIDKYHSMVLLNSPEVIFIKHGRLTNTWLRVGNGTGYYRYRINFIVSTNKKLKRLGWVSVSGT